MRIGYVVLPPALAEQFQRDFSFYSSSVPSFEQYTLVHFLQDGYFERHLNRMKKTYRQRQKMLTAMLQAHPLGQYLSIQGEEAGLHLLLEVHLPCTEQELVAAANQAHVTVYGLSAYYETPQNPSAFPQIVLGYACLSPEELQQGTERLLNSWMQFLS
ncbi:MAG: aminotransferase class I/II-fold pyridoxal phosphate-dependent enzyme [Ruminococcus sp.]